MKDEAGFARCGHCAEHSPGDAVYCIGCGALLAPARPDVAGAAYTGATQPLRGSVPERAAQRIAYVSGQLREALVANRRLGVFALLALVIAGLIIASPGQAVVFEDITICFGM